jgi:chemotaxis protein MotB
MLPCDRYPGRLNAAAMKHLSLVMVGSLAAISLTLGGCGKSRELAYAKVQITELERQNAELEAALAACQAGGGHAQPEPADATPTPTQGDIERGKRDKMDYIAISSDVLFRPGSAVLSDKAKAALDKVISELKSQHAGQEILVEGHTDDDPIKRSKWEDNWDLAGGRARAVLHYLESKGIAAKQLGFAGYADQRPRGGDKARNRRVEILIGSQHK